jgi:uncharacterized protein
VQSKPEKKPNRLIHEKSPYLLQHAYNPVDWHTWSDEAFEKARAEDKPVFVSIGYSTCHWCHVMEQECFDDEQVARLMNEAFVSIKVDREERPDLDGEYIAVCQALGRSCGWPLNVIMTPTKNPFYVSSYIPKYSRFGLVGMVDLIPQIVSLWKTRRAELAAVGADVKMRITDSERRMAETPVGKEVMDDAYERLKLLFDAEYGGFGGAPKFPTPHNLLFLLRYWKRTGDKDALNMVEKTLTSMRLGGIFDQIGFGFHRYSTDAQWLVPHFEKMLYDQALLSIAYVEGFQATNKKEFAITARAVMEYVLRDLSSHEGGFFTAEDADSEGEEGKFYFWTEQEIRNVLPESEADLAVALFGIESGGNYVDSGERRRNGKNILHMVKQSEELAEKYGVSVGELDSRIEVIQRALLEARQRRVRPGKDDKILTDWNGLMIAAFARAGQVLGEPRYLAAAVGAADFLLAKMLNVDGTLFHRFVKGERAVEGFLDDYAFLTWGLLEIYEAIFDEKYLKAAFRLTDEMTVRFWDRENCGFFFSQTSSTDALTKRKEVYDGAMPSGNSVAFLNLLRLTRLDDIIGYEEKAAQMMRVFAADIRGSPSAHTFFLLGVNFVLGPVYRVVMVGESNWRSTSNILESLRTHYLPNLCLLLRAPDKAGFGYEVLDGRATAFVCRDKVCLPPTTEVSTMLKLLDISIAAAEKA